MVKLTYCLRRRPDLSWEEFSRYWREVHAPLVAARAELLGIRRYVQVRTAQDPALHEALQRRNDGSPPPFDGIAELWFDDVEALRKAWRSPEGQAVREDEKRFIDLERSYAFWAEDHHVR